MDRERIRSHKGVKILTLYKQHYLERYERPLECEYSCWGYYDGMSITEVKESKSTLYKKRSVAGISNLWYETVNKAKELRGYASQQNIGLFRCSLDDNDTREEKFWSQTNRKIFMSVCFIQLNDCVELEDFRTKLENMTNSEVELLAYFTFDNADLILFLQSNSYRIISEKIQEVDREDSVLYMHPVNSVWEKTLKMKYENNTAEFSDAAGETLINDKVKELRMDIAAKGGKEKEIKLRLGKSIFDYKLPGYERISISYNTAHENYSIFWKDTDIKTVLCLFLKDQFATHQNNLFGKTIYNIETRIQLEKEKLYKEGEIESWPDLLSEDIEKEDRHLSNWCRRQIEIFVKYMDASEQEHDDGLRSYCQAIIQTLNMLAQFENFGLSRNIFYIVAPAFRLFSKQLEKVTDREYHIIDNGNRDMIKESMRDFLDAINSSVYHAIHTDQIFLMIPGYSGTPFSIPTKLSLFYLWYLRAITNVLNDTNYEYQFYLTPVLESKPCTYPVMFGLPEEERLICVRVSQRSLFMPRPLLIILAHEAAHYVGKNFRCRFERYQSVTHTLAYLVAEGLIPEWSIGESDKEFMMSKKHDICTFIFDQFKVIMEEKISEECETITDDCYHVSQIREKLMSACAMILADENHELQSIILDLDKGVEGRDQSFEETMEYIALLDRLSEKCDKRRIELLGAGDFDKIITVLLKEYQEIFADAVASSLLQFGLEDYCEAFNISEGYLIEEGKMPQTIYNRKKIISTMFINKGNKAFPSENHEVRFRSRPQVAQRGMQKRKIIDYWANTDVVILGMRDYLKVCREEINKYMMEKEGRLEDIRKALAIFSSSEYDCSEIYSFVNEKAGEYMKNEKNNSML